jgi:hypothetical protein
MAPGHVDRTAKRVAMDPLRLFIWPQVSGATTYKVEFFRHGRRIFRALGANARFELPLSWRYQGRRLRLTPGAYTWRVSPGFGRAPHIHYRAPIVRSTWTLGPD